MRWLALPMRGIHTGQRRMGLASFLIIFTHYSPLARLPTLFLGYIPFSCPARIV